MYHAQKATRGNIERILTMVNAHRTNKTLFVLNYNQYYGYQLVNSTGSRNETARMPAREMLRYVQGMLRTYKEINT